jgi:hypothetical protein
MVVYLYEGMVQRRKIRGAVSMCRKLAVHVFKYYLTTNDNLI